MLRDVSELRARLEELDAVAEHLPPEVVARRLLSLACTGAGWPDNAPATENVRDALEREPGKTATDAKRRTDENLFRRVSARDNPFDSSPRVPVPSVDLSSSPFGGHGFLVTHQEDPADDGLYGAGYDEPDATDADEEPPNSDGHVCHYFEIPYPDRTDEPAVSEAGKASQEVSELQLAAEAGDSDDPGSGPDVAAVEGWVKSGDAAEQLGVSRAWVTMQCRAGTLNGVRTSLGWLVDPEEIRRRIGNAEPGGEPETKLCERCGDAEGPKPIGSFQVHGQNGRRYDVCKGCVTEANREARRRKKEPDHDPEEAPPRTGIKPFVPPTGAPPASVGEPELVPRSIGQATTGPPSVGEATSAPSAITVDNPALSDAPDREPYVDEYGRRRCANRNRCVEAMGFEEGDRKPAVLKQYSPHLICRGCRKRAGQIG